MKTAGTVLALAGLVLVSQPAWADRVNIYNISGQNVSFHLRCVEGDTEWVREKMEAETARWFDYEGCKAYIIALSTKSSNGEAKKVQYKLSARKSYNLIWSDKKKIYDITKTSE